jgi:hypothetical protein
MDRNLKIYLTIVGVFLLAFFFMMGLWLIDISVSAMNTGGTMMSGLGAVYDPVLMYHVRLWMATGSFAALVAVMAYFAARVLGDERRE